jgi:ABC toxin-like protein/neuraminidase-like protein
MVTVPKLTAKEATTAAASAATPSTDPPPPTLAPGELLVGHIHTDGSITVNATSTVPVGYVALDGTVYSTNGVLLASLWTRYSLKVVRTDKPTGPGADGSVTSPDSKLVINGVTTATPWSVTYDDCDLTKVQLQHLDGKSVTRHEYDRMHRFLRLWRKLSWTIAEVDAAISAFGAGPQLGGGTTPTGGTSGVDNDVDYGDFQEPCDCGNASCDKCNGQKPSTIDSSVKPYTHGSSSGGKYCGHCGKLKPVHKKKPTHKHCSCKHGKDNSGTPKPTTPDIQPTLDISPFLITQIAAVKKIVDLVGTSLLQVLTLWTAIDQHGDSSLYAQLFLTHNILGIDRVFAADADGNYLVQSPPAKISEHRPVILAAFNLKSDDLSDIIRIAAVSDDLTLDNISAIYRHSIFAKMLVLKPKYLEQFFNIFSAPWASAEKALELLKLWTKITDAGFSIQQLAYIFSNVDDPLHPIGPTDLFVSQLAANIYTNLKDIESQQQNVTSEDEATSALVTAKAQLIFSQSTVTDIVGFLEGTRVYSTNAPKIDNITIPVNLKGKLKYVAGESPTLQTTGQLTTDEVGQAKAVSSNPKWSAALSRLSKQAATFFNTTLAPIFPNKAEAMSQLVSGDVLASTSSDNPGTAPTKRLYFLQSFIPFLQSQLSTQSIVSTMASAASIGNPIVTALLQDILVLPSTAGAAGKSALQAIEAIKSDPSSQTSWNGYLVVSTTDKYTFYANSVKDDNQPASISLNGVTYEFSQQQEDPTNVWFGQPIRLTGGQMYTLQVGDQLATKLSWKTDISVPSLIPSSFLIPAHATSAVRSVLVLLMKAAFYINNFNLTLDEVNYFQINGADFAEFNWNSLTLDYLKRLNAYALLRTGLPKSNSYTLLQLFSWAKLPTSKAVDIPAQINKVTQWKVDVVATFIGPANFNLQNPADFKNEVNMTKLKDAIAAASAINVDIDNLFIWAKPAVSFTSLETISDEIRTAIRTKYTLSDWDKAIKPTFDSLRQNQSNALVAYLVSQPALIEQGVIDADSLFEFFLIDPSMCPCMQTSRLKQATSSVQLFIQRCLLGLEDQDKGFGTGVSVNLIDRQRWNWMQRYRLWEANRKVYLFPENWIQSSLRDDKSPEFQQLESQLLQGDITEQTTLNALKNYLFAVNEVANLQTVAVYAEDIPGAKGKNNTIPNIQTVHFFARPAVAPYKYYYRTFDCVYATWTPWRLMQIDVPNYEIERLSSGNRNLNGCYIVPFTYNGRLVVGLPQFLKKQKPQEIPDQSFSDMAQGTTPTHPNKLAPQEYWEIKFGYTELLNGTWTQKVISNQAIWEDPTAVAPPVSEYQFVPEVQDPDITKDQVLYINVLHNTKTVGRFAFNGSRVTRDNSTAVAASGTTRTFQYTDSTNIHTVTSLQALSSKDTELEYPSEPSVTYPVDTTLVSRVAFTGSVNEPFDHPFLHQLVAQASRATTLDDFFSYFQTSTIDKKEAWGMHLWRNDPAGQYNELYRTYALYNWEMAFHAPMMLAEKLLDTQQFDLALKMCHYVFDPFAKGAGVQRYWQMPAFQDVVTSSESLDAIFAPLQPHTSVPIDDPINQWRKNPFEPHVLARLRPVAYMKWAVMKYIQILIAYGDWYFQQNTLEMIPIAIQMYVLASHVYGQRGQKIPRRGKKKPETYLTLLNSWDAFGNAMVQLELEFPFSNQIQKSFGNSNGIKGLANIFGFATNRYFCIPNNDQLTALRDTIDDRLYKIRHCEDIKGVFRILPLYEPALDVGQLVAATAAGLSLRSVLNDLNTPMPNYKFTIMLGKAMELCNELKSLGTAFLSAKEKEDAEALSILRQQHDISIQNLMMESKKLALQDAQATLDQLVYSRKRPEYQLTHALKMLGQDTGLVPGTDDDWKELVDEIAAPVQDSGLMISAEEKEEMDKSSQAKDVNTSTSVIQSIASDLKAFPIINGHASPFGVGVAACFGPGFIGDVMNGGKIQLFHTHLVLC